MTKSIRFTALGLLLLAASPRLTFAGPPLLCFPFEIGSAKTLPMGTGGWHSIDPAYDISRLVDDTISLLAPDTPVIVRMETLRRATVYAADNPAIGAALLAKLEARAKQGTDVMAVFDFGYAAETFKQARPMFKTPIPAVDGIDGYTLVQIAIAKRPNPAMEFAAAVITQDRARSGEHRAHLERATAGAKQDSTLAANLKSHFTER